MSETQGPQKPRATLAMNFGRAGNVTLQSRDGNIVAASTADLTANLRMLPSALIDHILEGSGVPKGQGTLLHGSAVLEIIDRQPSSGRLTAVQQFLGNVSQIVVEKLTDNSRLYIAGNIPAALTQMKVPLGDTFVTGTLRTYVHNADRILSLGDGTTEAPVARRANGGDAGPGRPRETPPGTPRGWSVAPL